MNNLCFVILNYRQTELTINNAITISKNFPECKIVVVDNESKDGSLEVIRNRLRKITGIRIIASAENGGYAKGNNLGIKKAISEFNPEFVAIMNPDVKLIDPSIIPTLLKHLYENPSLAFCTGLMLGPGNSLDYRRVAWKIPDNFDDCFLNIPFLNSRFNPVNYRFFSIDSNSLAFVEVIPGSFFIARIKLFNEMGFFDESTFLYCEERILGFKAKALGYKIGLLMDTFFLHDHPIRERSLHDTLNTYLECFRSRRYFTLNYNSLPKALILPLFYCSGLLGVTMTFFIWVIRKIFVKSLK